MLLAEAYADARWRIGWSGNVKSELPVGIGRIPLGRAFGGGDLPRAFLRAELSDAQGFAVLGENRNLAFDFYFGESIHTPTDVAARAQTFDRVG